MAHSGNGSAPLTSSPGYALKICIEITDDDVFKSIHCELVFWFSSSNSIEKPSSSDVINISLGLKFLLKDF